ncbi:hypothetical protein BLAT2472_10329 [Burkholderia latens]
MPPGDAGAMPIARTGLNVMGNSDSNERGHDPTPCSSSVCVGRHGSFAEATMPGFAWHILTRCPDGMREDSNGDHRHSMGKRRILAVRACPRAAPSETDWCDFGKAARPANHSGATAFTLA